jgi:SAM-dependent methyltransferase
MTLIGIWLRAPDHAFAWADSETYRSGDPCGHRMKMVLSDRAGIVAVAAGDTLLIDLLAHVVDQVESLDDLADKLPRAARADWNPPAHLRVKGAPCARVLAVGCGPWRTLAAYRFVADGGFAPQSVSGFELSPYVRAIERCNPRQPRDLLPIAHLQMVEVQKILPDAGAGSLTVAELRGRSITLHPFFDFAAGFRRLGAPRNPLVGAR